MKAFSELPEEFRTEEVRVYYDILSKKTGSLILKRVTDILISLVLLIFLIIPIIVICIVVRLDSSGPIFSGRKELLPTANASKS